MTDKLETIETTKKKVEVIAKAPDYQTRDKVLIEVLLEILNLLKGK